MSEDPQYQMIALDASVHDRSGFDCGVAPLNRYLREQASQEMKRKVAGCWVLVTRTSDGQMLFLANMVAKMRHDTTLGSRIAEVHNGSSLFTGDAGQGDSNIRRWIIENDWLEAIVALPLNLRVHHQQAHRRAERCELRLHRLTADVVTDKLDVRAAAAQLPEEAEDEPLPDPELPEEETEFEEVE